MGKKKHKGQVYEQRDDNGPPFTLPPQVAGLAAAALKQVNTPAFQNLVAGALGAATQAFDAKRGARPTPAQPEPPQPPQPPQPPHPFATPAGDEPAAATPEIKLSPEAAQALDQVSAQASKAIEAAAVLASQAIGSASAALERWAEKQRTRSDEPPATPPTP